MIQPALRDLAPTRALAAMVAVGLMIFATQAQAHAHLVSATPAADSAVTAPRTIVLRFSETLEPKFSGADLTTADGGKTGVAFALSAQDPKVIVGEVGARLAAGGYRVAWHVVSADGHRMTGAYAFTVR